MAEKEKNLLPAPAANDDEMEINLAGMLAYILRRWKSIVAAGLVCAVAVALVAYGLNLAEAIASSDYSDEAYDDLIAELELTKAEVAEVESLFDQYESYQKQIDLYEEVYASSYVLTLDPNEVVTYSAEYVYTSDYPGTVTSFSMQTVGQEEYEEIARILGMEEANSSISSILTISGSMAEDDTDEDDTDEGYRIDEGYQINVQGDADNQSASITAAYSGKLYFTVIGPDEETCIQVADVVREAMQVHLKELNEAGVRVELTEVSTNCAIAGDTSILSAYESAMSTIAMLQTTVSELTQNYVDNLSSDQQELYEFLLAKYRAEDNEEIKVGISKKMAAIGLILGVVLMAVLYAVFYLLDGTVKDPDEAQKMVGRPVLGLLRGEKTYRGLNGLFEHWADLLSYGSRECRLEGQKCLVEERIAECAQRCGAGKVFLVTDSRDEKVAALLDEVCKSQALGGVNVLMGNPSAEGTDFLQMKESDLSVIVVRLMETPSRSVREDVEICRELGQNVAGLVIVGEL